MFGRPFREAGAVGCLVVALFTGLCLLSFTPEDPTPFDARFGSSARPRPENLGGAVGATLAYCLLQPLGYSAFVVPIFLAVAAILLFMRRGYPFELLKIPFGVAFIVCLSTFLAMVLDGRVPSRAGGFLGGTIAIGMVRYFNRTGAYFIVSAALLITFIVFTGLSVSATGAVIVKVASVAWRGLRGAAGRLGRGLRYLLAPLLRRLRKPAEEPGPVVDPKPALPILPLPRLPEEEDIFFEEPFPLDVESKPKEKKSKRSGSAKKGVEDDEDLPVAQEAFPFAKEPGVYRLPPVSLLDAGSQPEGILDREALVRKSAVLEQKLADFGVVGQVTEIHPGPVITLYEFAPGPGIKVSRIMNLSDDLTMALKALSVRVLAPVPGKAVVGIEISNSVRETVFLRDLLVSEAFTKARAKSKLALTLGKDIGGHPYTGDLGKMPHLLIAGATGSGKSMLINSLICSLLFQSTPEDVKFLMIDPKMLELSYYEGIPHLLHPVITDPHKAAFGLSWVVEEMEERYKLMADRGVRNIEGFNKKAEQEAMGVRDMEDEDEEEDTGEMPGEASEPPERNVVLNSEGKLPFIVIVIDELADLMIVSARQVEEGITRLAQMARAAGIHLLLATQRPSVDVLTGIIKANLPSRIALSVSSKVDSRTILDQMGADKLLGKGDMLFLPPGSSRLIRMHGAFVSEFELTRLVKYLKKQGKPDYDTSITKPPVLEDDEDNDAFDEKYDEAVRLVVETGQASISMVQRRMHIGYNRAARMIEKMEKDRIVGPSDGVKPREVLVAKPMM